MPRRERHNIAKAIARERASARHLPPIWLAATIPSSDALSERGVVALVRLRGKRRVGRCAGSVGSSNVAFRGIKPDSATAIQAVAESGLYNG
jgi:hypothetical protein